jgi:hypothetical protein
MLTFAERASDLLKKVQTGPLAGARLRMLVFATAYGAVTARER